VSIETADVLNALERIVQSPLFKPKRNMCNLLRFIVEATAEGRAEELKGYTIALDVFNQSEDFDADRNPLVRVNAGRLRTLLRLYYLGDGQNDVVRIDVPTGSYVPTFEKNIPPETQQGAAAKTNTIRHNAISVVPFRNLSGRDDLEFFGTGFAQDLADALYVFDDLRVIGMSQRGTPEDTLCQRAQDRGIAVLVDGNIQALGPNLKIAVQMLNTADGATLWTAKFNLNIDHENAFAIKEQIVEQVAAQLGGEYGHMNRAMQAGIASALYETPNEQIALLKMYNYNARMELEDLLDLYETTERYLKEDPDSGLLHAIMADKHGTHYALDFPEAEGTYELLGEHAERAFKHNPDHQIVRAVLAFKCFHYRERDRFFRLLEENVDAAASSPLRLGTYAMYACHFGEWDLGKPLLDRVFESNAEVPTWLFGTSSLYHYQKGEFEQALTEANKINAPGLFWANAYRCVALSELGRFQEARSEYQQLLACRPDFEARGDYLLRRYIAEDSIVGRFKGSFQKFGISIAPDA